MPRIYDNRQSSRAMQWILTSLSILLLFSIYCNVSAYQRAINVQMQAKAAFQQATYSLLDALQCINRTDSVSDFDSCAGHVDITSGILIGIDSEFKDLGVDHLYSIGIYLQGISGALAGRPSLPGMTRVQAIQALRFIYSKFQFDLQPGGWVRVIRLRRSISEIHASMPSNVRSYFASTW